MVAVESLILPLAPVLVLVWCVAFRRQLPHMVASMGPAYSAFVVALVLLAILAPALGGLARVFDSFWTEAWDLARGALYAVLAIAGWAGTAPMHTHKKEA